MEERGIGQRSNVGVSVLPDFCHDSVDSCRRWTGSKASPVSHHPPIGLIHALSLSYPIPTSGRQRELVVGKAHSRINSNILSPQCLPTPDPSGALESSGSTAPTKMTHRQKYEALMAATTRPAPYVLSASLGMAAIVRSDPLSGKVSKGFWGPGRDGELTNTCLVNSS